MRAYLSLVSGSKICVKYSSATLKATKKYFGYKS